MQSILLATKDQLHYTVKRTMAENEQMTTELTYQSKETERILEMNGRLQKENGDLRRSCEVRLEAIFSARACIVPPCAMFLTYIISAYVFSICSRAHACAKRSGLPLACFALLGRGAHVACVPRLWQRQSFLCTLLAHVIWRKHPMLVV